MNYLDSISLGLYIFLFLVGEVFESHLFELFLLPFDPSERRFLLSLLGQGQFLNGATPLLFVMVLRFLKTLKALFILGFFDQKSLYFSLKCYIYIFSYVT